MNLRPRACDHHTDVVEDRGDRRVRLVNRYLDGADTGKGRQDRFCDCACCAFEQIVVVAFEGGARGRHHVGIGHGVGELVGAGRFRQIDR